MEYDRVGSVSFARGRCRRYRRRVPRPESAIGLNLAHNVARQLLRFRRSRPMVRRSMRGVRRVVGESALGKLQAWTLALAGLSLMAACPRGGTSAGMLHGSEIWEEVPTAGASVAPEGRTYRLRGDRLERALRDLGKSGHQNQRLSAQIPTRGGGYETFIIERSEVLSPELQAQWPAVLTFKGRSVVDSSRSIRIELGPNGLGAEVRSPNDAFFLKPDVDNRQYRVFERPPRRPSAGPNDNRELP